MQTRASATLHRPATKQARRLAVLLLAALAACGGPPRRPSAPPAAPPPPAAPAAPPPFNPSEVWTRQPGLALRSDSGTTVLPYIFMRLQVLRIDSTAVLVRCQVCRGQPTGWIDTARVVHTPRPPRESARMELADFALTVRDAAIRRDYETLRVAMAPDFIHTLNGVEGTLEAIGAWRRDRAVDLQRLPYLLDRGIATVPTTPVWAAPPEYATQRNYADLRAGFRQGRDGWEWLFLVRAEL